MSLFPARWKEERQNEGAWCGNQAQIFFMAVNPGLLRRLSLLCRLCMCPCNMLELQLTENLLSARKMCQEHRLRGCPHADLATRSWGCCRASHGKSRPSSSSLLVHIFTRSSPSQKLFFMPFLEAIFPLLVPEMARRDTQFTRQHGIHITECKYVCQMDLLFPPLPGWALCAASSLSDTSQGLITPPHSPAMCKPLGCSGPRCPPWLWVHPGSLGAFQIGGRSFGSPAQPGDFPPLPITPKKCCQSKQFPLQASQSIPLLIGCILMPFKGLPPRLQGRPGERARCSKYRAPRVDNHSTKSSVSIRNPLMSLAGIAHFNSSVPSQPK